MLYEIFMAAVLSNAPGESDELFVARCRAIVAIKAQALSVAPSPPQPDDNAAGCKCNGSKKSGDGIGPCVCGSKCKCKRGDDHGSIGTEKSADAAECEGQSCKISEPLSDVIKKPAKPLLSLPKQELLLFTTANGPCPFCENAKQDLAQGKLPAQTRIIEMKDHLDLYVKFNVKQVPTYIYTVDDVEVSRVIGYTTPANVKTLLPIKSSSGSSYFKKQPLILQSSR